MRCWPVPNSYSKIIPVNGHPESFWEDREDRRHCGVDIYAPKESDVLSIEDGKVIDIGIFTSPDRVSYWNTTYYVLIKNETCLICKYAELGDIVVVTGEYLKAGQLIGHIGSVLNTDEITEDSPQYIQELKESGNVSMLHFELYGSIPIDTDDYLGGNLFSQIRPKNLLDPTDYLNSIKHDSVRLIS